METKGRLGSSSLKSTSRSIALIEENTNPDTSTWLVVLTILKHISQWEGLSHFLWKKKSCSKPPTRYYWPLLSLSVMCFQTSSRLFCVPCGPMSRPSHVWPHIPRFPGRSRVESLTAGPFRKIFLGFAEAADIPLIDPSSGFPIGKIWRFPKSWGYP